ncbi:tetratricopeptide repeat protein [Nitrospinaceae bacterium]|nr:tetratricopeptide repeat protein [Nitrospinaceae bacterium]
MAKTAKVRRKDLIQPDQFISTTDILIAYCSKHKTGLISIVISLIVVVFSGIWIKYIQNEKSLSMESLYFKVEQAKSAKESNSKEKIKQIGIILEEFSEGPQKQRALLVLADEYFNEASYDKAIDFYQNILNGSPSSLHHHFANMGIAYSLEGKKDYKNAINAYKRTIQYSNEYPLFDLYVGLARCYELNKEKNEALLTLRGMQNKFPSHSKIDVIKSKIKSLGG